MIDFQSINGKLFQITQGSVSGTEIVNRNLNSEFSEFFQDIDGHLYIGHNCGLSDLDFQIFWMNSLRNYNIFDLFNQVRLFQLPARKVDPYFYSVPVLLAPLLDLAARGFKGPFPKFMNKSALLGNGNEYRRRNMFPIGSVPANKGFQSFNLLGLVLFDLGRWSQAETQYLQALAQEPDSVEVHNNLGLLYYRQGRMQEAEAQYLSGLHKDFEYFGLHFNLGNLYRAMGRLNEAVAAYRLAIRFNARWAAPHNHLGEVYLELGLKDQAEVEFTAAVAVELKNESAD